MAFVYHIHLPEHKGMYEKGYIGFTSLSVEERFKNHIYNAFSRNKLDYPLYRAMRKYKEELVVTTLIEGSSEYCLEIEYKLRNTPFIGWNMSCGGTAPMLGKRHSKESLLKISAAVLGRKATQETKLKLSKPKEESHRQNISKALSGLKKTESHVKAMSEAMKLKNEDIGPWENIRASKQAWSLVSEIDYYMKSFPDHSTGKIAKNFNLGSRSFVVTICKNIIAGWKYLEDKAYLAWLEEYKTKQGGHDGT